MTTEGPSPTKEASASAKPQSSYGKKTERHATRRAFLAGTLTTLTAGWLYAGTERPARASVPAINDNPFTLGVASGYPTASSVVLWTRLALYPTQPDGGMPPAPIPVQWEVATDENMRRVVQRGVEYATPEWAHSVHAEPQGLEAGREYWYRFTACGVRSVVGRTRTTPAEGSSLARLKLAVASCQHYEQGYFTAYDHMIRDDLHLILHVGDYIYEGCGGGSTVRSHSAPEATTLDDYRARYALYKTDANLAAAHAAYPWMVTWDDHEVSDDYAGESLSHPSVVKDFRARRRAAYKAYYEHMPLPKAAMHSDSHLRLYAQRTYGDLASIYMLDQRQFRSPECHGQPRQAAGRTMLGAEQEAWLAQGLQSSGARWNVLAQGTMMSHLVPDAEAATRYGADAWNGYPAARARLTESLAELKVRNPVVVSGDIHAFVVGGLNRVPEDFSSPFVAPEFVGSSVSSDAGTQGMDCLRRQNPNVQFADNGHRGYLRFDITSKRMKVDLVALNSVKVRHSRTRTLASYAVEDGRPGAVAI